MKKLIENNQGISAIIVIIIIILILCCVLAFQYMANHQVVECRPGEERRIEGLLYGFYLTENEPFYNVHINDQNLTFRRWDKEYMSNLLGYDVVMVVCYRNDTFSPDPPYYDLKYAFIKT